LEAQTNYVLNPSFEIYDTCPRGGGNMNYARYWSNLDTLIPYIPCSPDYCNKCATLEVGIPIGGDWYNHFARTGSGMVLNGIYSDSTEPNPFIRVFAQGRLYKNLTAGESYCVTYFVALCQQSYYACNHNDAYLDDGSIDLAQTDTNCGHTIETAQIVEDSIIFDTIPAWRTNYWDTSYHSLYQNYWTKVQGSFVATGSENFITLGNFTPISDVTVARLRPYWGGGALYIIDDVSVVPSDAVADAGPDVAIGRGQSTWIGNDTAAIGGGAGMPCWWYAPGSSSAIDSGGRIQVSPDTTTTYVMMMDLCGNITYDTMTVWVWPLASPILQMNQLDNLTISPNPAKDHVEINGINKNIIYQLTNVLGQEITVGILIVGNSIIDLNSYLPGIYLLTLEDPDDGTKVVKRVIRE